MIARRAPSAQGDLSTRFETRSGLIHAPSTTTVHDRHRRRSPGTPGSPAGAGAPTRCGGGTRRSGSWRRRSAGPARGGWCSRSCRSRGGRRQGSGDAGAGCLPNAPRARLGRPAGGRWRFEASGVWNLSGPGARVASRPCRDVSVAQRRMEPERPGRPCGAGAGRWVLEPAPGASPCPQGWPTRAIPSNDRVAGVTSRE